MKLVELFGCRFQGGRAEAAPLTRTQASSKATISDAMGSHQERAQSQGETYAVQISENDPVMPHIVYSPEDLNELYPAIEVPDEIDGDDPADPENDPMYRAGMNTVADLMYHLAQQGRRRKLPEIERGESGQAWLAIGTAECRVPCLAFERADGSGANH